MHAKAGQEGWLWKCYPEVMAVQHKEYPIYGVQFQPESIMTSDGKAMLEKFIKIEM